MIGKLRKRSIYNNVYSVQQPTILQPVSQSAKQSQVVDVGVYRFGFQTNLAFVASLLLCSSLILQPIASVYAQEPTTITEVPESPPADTTPEPVMAESISEPDVLDDGDDVLDLPPAESNTIAVEASTSTSASAPVGSPASIPESVVIVASSTTQPSESEIETDQGDNPNLDVETDETNLNLDVETNSDDGDFDNNPEVATTTATQNAAVTVVQNDNVLAFNKNECTEVEDGSFYCQRIAYDQIAENDLFSAPDATGDMEIYVVQNGQQHKVTDNIYEDASPYFDAKSETIVWHRLINDRYQIISYDVQTGEETQLTDSSVNNMEPTRSGNYTVWQRWVKNNWEIILHTGSEERQLTDSIEHDIAPYIRGDLLIWNVRSSNGSQTLMTYDIGSDTFNQIKDSDGVSVANPRMLVMYEAQYQNGDTVMKGFDLLTGEIIPIQGTPRNIPPTIPDPDTTGEIRALPPTPQVEEDLVVDTDIDTGDDDPEPDPVLDQYEAGDLVITSTSTIATTTTVVAETEFDLDLRVPEPESVTTASSTLVQQAAIPDIVVPPLDLPAIENYTETASSTQ